MHKMGKLSFIVSILVLSVAMLTACGGGGGNTAPAPAPADPPAADAGTGNTDLIAVGEQQVQKSCIGCHGNDLQGGMGGQAPGLVGTTLSKEEIIDILANGRGAMPGGTAKGNEEAVAEYILSLQ